MGKCSFGDGVVVRPNGVDELDPCIYETIEIHRNVDVEILRCQQCGHTEIVWHRTDETKDEIIELENINDR